MILKADQGGYEDPTYASNSAVLRNNRIPYGAYDYSVYSNPYQATNEAYALHQQAPHAKFYVNDSEVNEAGGLLDASTQAWANEIHHLTNKPAVLYSDLAFMNNFAPQTRNAYDALWVAAYGPEPNPNYHYDLWQYTDSHYSPSLEQRIDASTFPDGSNKPLSFWVGHHYHRYSKPVIHYVTPKVVKKHYRHVHKIHKAVIKPITKRRRRHKQHVIKHYKHAVHYSYYQAYVKTGKRKYLNAHLRYLSHKYHHYTTDYIRRGYYHNLNHNEDRYLKVINPTGIWLYTTHGHRIGKAPYGATLYVNKYIITYYHKSFIYQAVGSHWGQPDIFTSNKRATSNNC